VGGFDHRRGSPDHDIFTSFLAPLLPLIIQKLGLSLTLAGSLAAFQQLPSLINPFLGLLADRGSFALAHRPDPHRHGHGHVPDRDSAELYDIDHPLARRRVQHRRLAHSHARHVARVSAGRWDRA